MDEAEKLEGFTGGKRVGSAEVVRKFNLDGFAVAVDIHHCADLPSIQAQIRPCAEKGHLVKQLKHRT